MRARQLACLIGAMSACLVAGQANLSVHYRTLHAKGKGWTAVHSYPVFGGKSPLAAFVNARMREAAREDVAANKRSGASDEAPPADSRPMTFDSKVTVTVATEKIVSLYFLEEDDLGGAHPMYAYPTATFGLVGGKPRQLKLKDLFPAGLNPRKIVNKLAMEKLRKNEGAAWVHDGEVKEMKPEQFENFVVTRSGLTFIFNPYEMGPFSSGAIFVKLSYKELGISPKL